MAVQALFLALRIGKYNQALSDRLRISWNMFTVFHPQTDGQTGRMNCTVKDTLRDSVSPTMTNRDELRFMRSLPSTIPGRSRCRTLSSTSIMAVTPERFECLT